MQLGSTKIVACFLLLLSKFNNNEYKFTMYTFRDKFMGTGHLRLVTNIFKWQNEKKSAIADIFMNEVIGFKRKEKFRCLK